jgi:carboxylesterase type B
VPIELGTNTSFGTALNATTQGPMCVQGPPAWAAVLTTLYGGGDDTSPAPVPSSEDCLILDIFAPASTTDEGLPVLLWIHGGGYTEGNAANAGGPNFVSSSNGSMVFVSIQYRLGAYGFLASEAVAEDGSPNAALLDQRAAIDWVDRHIGAFGGDPNKVSTTDRVSTLRSIQY